ncbi:MAG TPA: CAP domain-containing protein, partial [Actinomycetota bacterium]|nr:CAP domain-containing protein [Actinomycetota bacterium]
GTEVHSLHRAFMESPPHRANVLDKRFRYLGVGVARDGDMIWVTVLFEAEDNPGTTLDMPKGC